VGKNCTLRRFAIHQLIDFVPRQRLPIEQPPRHGLDRGAVPADQCARIVEALPPHDLGVPRFAEAVRFEQLERLGVID
jgi:hypothetical protein